MFNKQENQEAKGKAVKLKKYLENYFLQTKEEIIQDGINFCDSWIEILESEEKSNSKILSLENRAKNLSVQIHALEELRYEFVKWQQSQQFSKGE